ncbi:Uncharacterised protein [Vibrio cholerae]|nr:Uncharacterised protein [Vibrio cholerae]
MLFIKTEGALVGSFSNHTNPPMLTLINTVAGLTLTEIRGIIKSAIKGNLCDFRPTQ